MSRATRPRLGIAVNNGNWENTRFFGPHSIIDTGNTGLKGDAVRDGQQNRTLLNIELGLHGALRGQVDTISLQPRGIAANRRNRFLRTVPAKEIPILAEKAVEQDVQQNTRKSSMPSAV